MNTDKHGFGNVGASLVDARDGGTDARSSGAAAYTTGNPGTTLTDAVRGLSLGRQVPPIEAPGLESSPTTPISLRLSATFVEWMMGFPRASSIALSDSDVWPTPSSPGTGQQH